MKSLELVIYISFRDLQTADGPGEIYSSISLFFGLPLSLLTLVNGQRNQYLNFCLFFFFFFFLLDVPTTRPANKKKKKQTRSYSSLAGWVSITCVYCLFVVKCFFDSWRTFLPQNIRGRIFQFPRRLTQNSKSQPIFYNEMR